MVHGAGSPCAAGILGGMPELQPEPPLDSHFRPKTRPPTRNIVVGQRVTEGKVIRAREFRKAMTPAEAVLWKCLRGNRMHGLQFRRQQIIDGFIVDFYCHAMGLIVEVDGPVHDSPDSYDVERGRILSARNLHVMRFSNNAVLSNTEAVLAHISRFIRDRS